LPLLAWIFSSSTWGTIPVQLDSDGLHIANSSDEKETQKTDGVHQREASPESTRGQPIFAGFVSDRAGSADESNHFFASELRLESKTARFPEAASVMNRLRDGAEHE
jgi:hypothetical protein